MVSVSPRLTDCLEDEEPDSDPRFVLGFRSVSIGSSEYDHFQPQDDHRPLSAGGDPGSMRRKSRLRQSNERFDQLQTFTYRTCADGQLFRLFELLPGTGTQPIEGRLTFEHSDHPERDYTCLSYCWMSELRDVDIVCDGFRLAVTRNLLAALRSLRDPRGSFFIWIDQLCIDQDNDHERGYQVSIMDRIFSKAKDVVVWLGESNDKLKKLCEYARKMRRSNDDSPKQFLKRLLTPRKLQEAIQELLQRPWWYRVWVVQEVALSKFCIVQIGRDQISWDNLVRLVKDIPLPYGGGFDKQVCLLGNPRQRISLLTQLRRNKKPHTDIAQLLVIAKGSEATDVHDFVYAFYGLTWLRTFPDYFRPPALLFVEITQHYCNSIRWDNSYSIPHELNDEQRTSQLMSILYAAGRLHQHFDLPSWVPDWTFKWHLAPIWCKPCTNFTIDTDRNEWSAGIRSNFRAGGPSCGEFEVVERLQGKHHLRISVIILDRIVAVGETAPPSTFASSNKQSMVADPSTKYGRIWFSTREYEGIATPGIEAGDYVAILVGGDVPVIIRPWSDDHHSTSCYKLLCECFAQDEAVMNGRLMASRKQSITDITFV